MDQVHLWLGQLESWAESLAGTGWIFLVMYVFATIDGFFPPIPSESLVIALTTIWRSTGSPAIGWVIVAAAAGAFTGDQIAYQIGRFVKIRRLRIFRGARGQATLDWADHALEHRGASFIIAARYVPIGRVAVNMTAGALRFKRSRFIVIDAVASVLWAIYAAVIGIAAGAVFGHNPFLAVVVGIVAGIGLGFVVDRVIQRFAPVPAHTGEEPALAAAPPPTRAP